MVGLPFDLFRRGYFIARERGRGGFFAFQKISQFPSKYAVLRRVDLNMTSIIANLYRAILIFREFLPADPLPTREKCRNMAKIVQLLSLPKFRFAGAVIRWVVSVSYTHLTLPTIYSV